jgi:hypothetical protein
MNAAEFLASYALKAGEKFEGDRTPNHTAI